MKPIHIAAAALTTFALALPATAAPGGNGNGKGHGQEAMKQSAAANPSTGACPPGLAKKDPACIPPGQAKKQFDVGDRIGSNVTLVRTYEGLPTLGEGYGYYRTDGYIYEVDETTRAIRDVIALANLLN